MTLFRPTNELVVVAWLKGIAFIGSNASTTLPADNSTWAASGFVQVSPAGGSAHAYLPLGQPVMTLDCFACAQNSSRPPWNKAFQLAQQIMDHVQRTPELVARDVTLKDTYRPARVLAAWPVSEPKRNRSDPADYARVTLDMEFRWRETQ